MVVKINVNAWKVKSAAAKAKIKSSANDYVRRTAFKVLNEALKVSPQWSGEYAASWELVVSASNVNYARTSPVYKSMKVTPWYSIDREDAKKVGSPEAIKYALAQASTEVDRIKWNTSIALINVSPTAHIVESPDFKPRYDGGGATTPVLAHLKMKFNYLNKT